jgi:UbiD family decarboxylase
MDELDVIGAVRGAPVPVVKCVTVDVKVPADAEMVLEGYIDERGLVEPEGPYGEYIGYYGLLKSNPVFHLTAITRRRDALFQTVTIGGARLGYTDTAQLGAAKTEAAIWNVLQQAIREPVAVCCTASSGGMYNVRVSLRQRNPGEARNAIAAVFCSSGDVKHVFVVDDDVDVFSDEQIDWALATRFQADRDFVVASGFRCVPPRSLAARQPHRCERRVRLHQALRQGQQRRVHGAASAADAATSAPLARSGAERRPRHLSRAHGGTRDP